ncbi:MAG TPA: hypothetical protein VMG08_02165 [Allosphingosinicella sp.]|nr:hypothetical protein [Allosphingosinicella sp.]
MGLAAALVALPAPALAREQVDVCGPLGQLIAAARERPAFASVQRRLAAGETLLPGFGEDSSRCAVTPGREASCRDSFGRVSFIGWPDLDTCRGVVAVGEQPPLVPDPLNPRRDWTRTYRAGNLRIEHGMTCTSCRGPAPSHFRIFVEQPRRRSR